jgi:hypothetical protein
MARKDRKMIRVEPAHITGAMPESSSKCMVAEAMRSSIPSATRPHVDMQTLRYTDADGVRRVYLTPASVQAALVRFDAGDPVEPFTFKLPDPIHISKRTRGIKSGEAKRRHVRTVVDRPGPRVGGHSVPILGSATRRRFGIRHLRINQEGKVIQSSAE